MYDLVTIGDLTIDNFLRIHDAEVSLKHHPDRQQLVIDYGSKIPVDAFFRFPAGNAPNNAVGASRLGLKTAIYGMVGKDSDGWWIKNELEKEQVAGQFIRTDLKKPTNQSTVLIFQKERSIFVWHQTRQYSLPPLPNTQWLYLTSMGPLGPQLDSIHRQILGFVKSHDLKLAFNPGTYQLQMGRSALRPFTERCEAMFLNKEETQELTGKNTSDIKVLLRALLELGPKVAIVTDGPNGSFAYDGTTYYACGIYDIPAVERTGAGDSYSTGFIAATHYGLPIKEAMRWGTFNAAYVLGQVGGILGLVKKHEMLLLTQEHPELKVKEI